MKRIILGMSVCCLLLATLSGGCATVSGGWNTATVKQAANGWVMVTLTKQRDAASTPTGETTPEVWVSSEIPPADWNK